MIKSKLVLGELGQSIGATNGKESSLTSLPWQKESEMDSLLVLLSLAKRSLTKLNRFSSIRLVVGIFNAELVWKF